MPRAIPTVDDYVPYGPPFWDWQGDAFRKLAPLHCSAFFSEPRCGKSKPSLAIDCWRHALDYDDPRYVDLVLGIAMPSNVPVNWAEVEVPKHVDPDLSPLTIVWKADQAKRLDEQMREAEWHPGLVFIFVNGEAVLSEKFLAHLRRIFPKRRVSVKGDESTLLMKQPGKRADKMWAISRQKTVVRRSILDGTPTGESPFDLYTQMRFLDERILGFETFAAFQGHHATRKDEWDKDKREAFVEAAREAEGRGMTPEDVSRYAHARARNVGKRWWDFERDKAGQIIYKNLDELHPKMEPWSVRVRRRDVFRTPEKVYQMAHFELTKEQRRVYDELRQTYEAELRTGERIEARHVLTRLGRLGQICANYYPSERRVAVCPACEGAGCDACEGDGFVETGREPPRVIDPDHNPLLEVCLHHLAPGQQSVVWTRYQAETDELMKVLREKGFRPAQYDGRVSAAGKRQVQTDFNAGLVNPVVGTPRAGGRGVTLLARLLFYYRNDYSLLNRLQSEDRPEVPNMEVGTDIVDAVAIGTNDTRIVQALRAKRKIGDIVMREESGRWL